MKRGIRKWLFILLHLLGFILLWFVVGIRIDHVLQFATDISLLEIPFKNWILLIVYAIKSLHWHLLNQSFQIQPPGKQPWYYLLPGFLSVITPGRSGEFVKIYFLKRKYGIDISSATSFGIPGPDMGCAGFRCTAGMSVVVLLSDARINMFSFVLMCLLFLVSLMILILPSLFFSPLLFLTKRFSKLHSKLNEVFRLWKNNRFIRFITSLTVTIGSFLMLAFIPVLFSMGTQFPIPYRLGIGAMSISNILSFLPVTIAGFGTRELVFAEVWKLSGYPLRKLPCRSQHPISW